MRRLHILLLASLWVASSTFAALRVRVGEESVAPGSPREQVLRNAIRSFVLSDGSAWITHRLSGYRENSPIGITRIHGEGTEALFRASDWLPEGTLAEGAAGQVYGVTDLDGGGLAAAVGWNRGGRSRNAIVVLKPESGGSYEAVRLIEVAGVSSLARGPKGTILALTDDPSRAGGGAMLTVFDTAGTVLGRFFPGQNTSAGEAVRNSIRSTVQRVNSFRYALYDDLRETIFLFDLHVDAYAAPALARVAERSRIFIGSDGTLARLPVIATHVGEDGHAIVVRTGVIEGAPRSVAVVFGSDGEIIGSWKSNHPWNAVIRSGNEFRGVVMREGVILEKAEFPDVR